jgi:peptidyl-prolyl cis-trans isomerase B (cyclophilin B)
MTNIFKTSLFAFIALVTILGCKESPSKDTTQETSKRKTLEMVTNYGTMVIELYNETPLHRDNFINLVTHKAYDSLLFHRVIDSFMIQAGDPDSKHATATDTIGSGDAPYSVAAEFDISLFHKKGALAAARDNNPEKASSAMQFYIVKGKVHNDSLLDLAEIYTNENKAMAYFQKKGTQQALLDSIQNALFSGKRSQYKALRDSTLQLAKASADFKSYVMPEPHKNIYKSIGGYPRLDQNYTVFGEVVEGLAIIDSISKVETGAFNRPKTPVRIQTLRLIN